MDRWKGRVAVVTGASGGIGAAVARRLVEKGMTVVGLARRETAMQEMADSLVDAGAAGKFIPRKCDLALESELVAAYAWVDSTLGGADVIVNNAGLADNSPLLEASTDAWRMMLDVNVLSLAVSTKLALTSMMARGVDDGHVVNINSLLGHKVIGNLLPFYTATKWAVTALCQSFQNELCVRQSHIRVSSICPGLTRTGLLPNFEEGKMAAALDPSDIADAVEYTLAAPSSVIVAEVKLAPNEGTVGHMLAPVRSLDQTQ
ncbi:dehydrogenase/reductase SDR family member 11-like [Macrosteles quadrilineatus]|uniref:dehydrogenase/reductase SDR family member 11-like n=1 Tax=Macrosteles quadrilineatus TaxID=74068 RepID=UPI0023E20D05|nr:dehydrogenase/reductase SDR family member 11-like [Macrosteles quadrilineatus]